MTRCTVVATARFVLQLVNIYHPLTPQGDLASRTLTLEGKRFYLDVKENQRGRFIKIAEMSADGRKVKSFSLETARADISITIIEPNSDGILNCWPVPPEPHQVH